MMNFCSYQPLFPGESGVDQLVEIIKVRHVLNNSIAIPIFTLLLA